MQWRRLFHRVSFLMIVAMIVTACATTPQSETNSSKSLNLTNTPSSASDSSPVTIRWRTRPSDAAEQAVYEALNTSVNAALADQHITVVFDAGVNQGYFEKLKTELASGNAPDIFWIGAVELADFVATGQLLDIAPYIQQNADFKVSDFYEQPIAELSRGDAIYGLPRDISTLVTYYNADLFAAVGLKNPQELIAEGNWNWDTLLKSVQQLTDPSKQQYGLGFGNWWGPSWGYFVNAAGGSLFNADRTACALNTPEAITGVTFVRELYSQQFIIPDDTTSEAAFNAGKVGMYFNGRWFTPGIRTNATFKWDVAEMPMGKTKSTWLFWGPYVVSAKTTNPDAVWKVLKYITSAESMAKVTELGTNIPARNNQSAVEVFLQSTPPEHNQAFLDGIAYAIPEAPLWNGSWADFNTTVQSLWDQMIVGQMTPEEFGAKACEQTNKVFIP